jgi:hypothetical protein
MLGEQPTTKLVPFNLPDHLHPGALHAQIEGPKARKHRKEAQLHVRSRGGWTPFWSHVHPGTAA